ncbi:MAG TPA: efflux RND transporter periplasmic adaptor subunit [Planctomycetaceae bacterium]|nr:efflux RND transporter periplasmic adaptor subunit [Planctomycetaceae bacterium]
MSTVTQRDQVAPRLATAPPARRRIAGVLLWMRGAAPTVGVVAVLAGLAYWGHRTEWTVPKFSALIGNGVHPADDWCKEHNVAESQCIECNSKLAPPLTDYGWCKEHGIAQCPLHHPDVAQSKSLQHVLAGDLERANRALALMPRPENNSRCRLYQRRIQFASAQAADKVGLDIAVVQERPIIETVVANGEVVYDETRMAHLSSRVPGSVWRVERKVGERVAKGAVLALIESADVGRAKSEFLQSIAHARLNQKVIERLRLGAQKGAVSERTLMEAETAYQEARIRLQSAQQTLVNLGFMVRAEQFAGADTDEITRQLQLLGVPPELVSMLDQTPTTSNLIPVRSPLDGVVIDRNVVEGEVIDPKTALFSVADTSRLWLTLSVRQEDAKYLSLGQPVLFHSSDSKDEQEMKGSLSWISTAADEQTRTVKVRVDLPNAGGRLKANTFGTGRIVLREEPKAIVVPSESVHWDGSCYVVFVRDKNYLKPNAPKFFHVRSVRPGVKQGETTEIIVGLLPGEVIAAKNSVVLEAQLLKSNLGAGCGCADGH